MYIYFFNALLILLWFLVSKLAKNPKKIFCVMVTLQLVVFLGLRDYASINIDMIRYYNHYVNLGRLSLVDSIFYSDSSQLYYLLCWLFSNMRISFQVFIFILAAFEMVVLGRYIYIYSYNPLVSFFAFLGTSLLAFSTYGLRQALAMSLVLLCFEMYMKKRYGLSVLFLLLAILTHLTAIVIIPFIIICKLTPSLKVFLGYLVVTIVTILFRQQIGQFLTIIFDEEYVGHYIVSGSIGGTAIVCISVTIIVYILNCVDNREISFIDRSICNGLLILSIIQILSSYAYSFTRLNFYFMQMIFIIGITMISASDKLTFIKKYDRKFISGVLNIVIISAMVYLMFNVAEQIPEYSFVWQ